MSRLVTWILHVLGMVFAVFVLDVSLLSGIQSCVGAGCVLLIHYATNKEWS